MELMRNFVERTSLEIDLVNDGDRIWQREAVRISVCFPFLQHALMALSGLHIFHMDPPSPMSYYYTACWHSTRASELFRTSVFNIDKSNWQPILIFLIASVIFNLDITFLDQTMNSANNAINPASILLIMRYPGSVSKQLISQLVSGSLATTLLHRQNRLQILVDEEVICAIKSLALFGRAELHSSLDAEEYNDAIKSLELWAESVSCQPQSWHGLVGWPVTISDRYIQLLQSGDEFAAVVFIHWCAVMNRAPSRYYLVKTIKNLAAVTITRLNPRWNILLQWPRKELQLIRI
jgi:hypothetical protein